MNLSHGLVRYIGRPATRSANIGPHLAKSVQFRQLSLAYSLHEAQPQQQDPNQAPIVILHGLFGSKQNNRSISKALARDLKTKVYAIDLRNHGESPHDPKHDYTSMADDIEEFMSMHGLRRPTLIGHSMGAKVIMTIALRSPSSVGSLIPVDNAPVDAILKSDFSKYVQGMKKILDAGVNRQADADEILKTFEESLPIRQFLLTNLLRNPATGKMDFRIPINVLGAALENMGDFPFNDPDRVRFDGPVLFVRGTKSHYVADDVLPLVGNFFPRFELVDIDCGHWVISEQPALFKEAVVEFLGTTD